MFDERLGLVVDPAHPVALAVRGVGALRFVLDPGAAPSELGRLVPKPLTAPAIEVPAVYRSGCLGVEDRA